MEVVITSLKVVLIMSYLKVILTSFTKSLQRVEMSI